MKRMAITAGILVSVLAFSVLFSLSPVSAWAASGKTRMAVVDFEQKAVQEFQGKQAGEIVAEWLITALVRTGRFDVVERAQLQKILKEQQLGVSGMINQETAARVGELLGVKVIITGSVIQFGNVVEVNTRLISVEDGSILKAEKIRGPGLEAIEGLMPSLADAIKKDFPIEGYVVQVTGNRVMIDVGRANGVEPGMRFQAFRRGAPIRHPVTGKTLKGEDIKIGEMAVQRVELESSWAEIVQEEPGIKIAAGNVVKYSTEEPAVVPPVGLAPSPAQPSTMPVRTWTGKIRSAKILIEWTGFNDLILGDRDGYVTLYPNQGTKDAPVYGTGAKMRAGGKEIKVRGPSAPCIVDWNEDGKPDLLVGDGGGYVHLFLNTGSAESPPNFAPGVMVQAAGKNLDVGRGDASPCVVDWNEDGRKDLLFGKANGELVLFINEGTNHQPVFGKGVTLNGGKLDVGSHSSPDMADLNGDGKKDLVVGNDNGEIFVFYNIGSNPDPQFANDGEKLNIKMSEDASPQVVSAGGLNHLVATDRYGEVAFFTNTGSPGIPSFGGKKIWKAGKR